MKKFLQLITFATFLVTGYSQGTSKIEDEIEFAKQNVRSMSANNLLEYRQNLRAMVICFIENLSKTRIKELEDAINKAKTALQKEQNPQEDSADLQINNVVNLQTAYIEILSYLDPKQEFTVNRTNKQILISNNGLWMDLKKNPNLLRLKSQTPLMTSPGASAAPPAPTGSSAHSSSQPSKGKGAMPPTPASSVITYANQPASHLFAGYGQEGGFKGSTMSQADQEPLSDRVNKFFYCYTCRNEVESPATSGGETRVCRDCHSNNNPQSFDGIVFQRKKPATYAQGNLNEALIHWMNKNVTKVDVTSIDAENNDYINSADTIIRTNELAKNNIVNVVLDTIAEKNRDIAGFISSIKRTPPYVNNFKVNGGALAALKHALYIMHYIPATIAANAIAMCVDNQTSLKDAFVNIFYILNATYQMYDNAYVHFDIVAQMLTNNQELEERFYFQNWMAGPQSHRSSVSSLGSSPDQQKGISTLSTQALEQHTAKTGSMNLLSLPQSKTAAPTAIGGYGNPPLPSVKSHSSQPTTATFSNQ